MTTVARSAEIDAPLAAVWAVLADFGSIGAWAPDVDHSCLMSDLPGGVGAARRVQVGQITLVETVITWEPRSALGYRIEGLPPIVDVTNEWRLAARGESTEVTLTTRVDGGPRPPRRLIATLIASRMAKASEGMLAGLARHLAQTPEPTG